MSPGELDYVKHKVLRAAQRAGKDTHPKFLDAIDALPDRKILNSLPADVTKWVDDELNKLIQRAFKG